MVDAPWTFKHHLREALVWVQSISNLVMEKIKKRGRNVENEESGQEPKHIPQATLPYAPKTRNQA